MLLNKTKDNYPMEADDACFSSSEIVTQDFTVGKPQNSPQRRHVSFFEIVTIKSHIHFRDFSPEEIEGTWYKKEEFTAMKLDCIPVVKLIARGLYTGDTDELCARGVEYRTRETAYERKINKLNGLRAVLTAQASKTVDGQSDEELIRHEYTNVGIECQMAARGRALNDWEVAKSIYQNDMRAIQERRKHEGKKDDISTCPTYPMMDDESESPNDGFEPPRQKIHMSRHPIARLLIGRRKSKK